ITTEVLRYLKEDGRIPVWDGQPQPLCAVWEPRPIDPSRRSVTRLIAEAGLEMIPEPELRARFAGQPLANVNTPEELEEAQRHGSR
ncbi:MAG TPA: hypothetical protein VF111_12460, partial [Thermoanaerobaculia bacterium]